MSRNSTKARRLCFTTHRREVDGKTIMTCHLCSGPIDPLRDKWEADHIRRHAEGGEESAENLWPAHEKCHAEKSRKDTSEIAKGKRVSDKHFGIKQKTGFRKPPPGMKYDWKRGGYRKDDD